MMIAANRNNDDNEGERQPPAESHSQSPQASQPKTEIVGKGETYFPANKKGLQAINQAARLGFRLSRKMKHRAMMVADQCLDSPDEDIRMSAVRAMVSAEAVNARVAELKANKTHNHLHLHGGASGQPAAKPVEYDPEYAEYLRQRAFAEDVHPGDVRPSG